MQYFAQALKVCCSLGRQSFNRAMSLTTEFLLETREDVIVAVRAILPLFARLPLGYPCLIRRYISLIFYFL